MSKALDSCIDFEMGKVYLGRDHDSFLKRFVEVDLQGYITKLQSCIYSSEYEELIKCADSLFSTSSYVGAIKCQDISKRLTNLYKEKKFKLLNFEVNKLIEHSKILENLTKQYFNENGASHNSENLDRITSSTLEDAVEYRSFRLRPPKKPKKVRNEVTYEEEIDPFEEINKQWQCEVF